MADTMRCPEPKRLQQLLLGRLPEAEAERLERHVAKCDRCSRLLPTLPADDSLVAAMRALPQGALPPTDRTMIRSLLPRLHRLRVAPAHHGTGENPPRKDDLMSGDHQVFKFLSPPQSADEIGRLGPYRVLKLLGKGGMGVVFLAEDPGLQRTVALKVMLPEVAKRPTARERFLREARATAKIEHDHIVTIYQVGEDRGVPYLAMQLLKGMSLEDLLRKKQNKPTLEQVMKLGREMAKGLAAAHEKGMIHRDIKPANIWLDANAGGRVKILDFGLARAAEGDRNLTQIGTVVGTAAYMAPEQARSDKIDGRADLFSLGCVLYRLCTGRLPWRGEDATATLLLVATESPRSVEELNPELPPKLAQLIMKLLSKKPEDRPASGKAVVEALQGIERDLPTMQMKAVIPVAALAPDSSISYQSEPTQVLTMSRRQASRARGGRSWLVAAAVVAITVFAAVAGSLAVLFLWPGPEKVASTDKAPPGKTKEKAPAKTKDKPLVKTKDVKKPAPQKQEYAGPDALTKKTPPKDPPLANPVPADPKPLTEMGTPFTNSIGMELARIQPGEFVMGSALEEMKRFNVPDYARLEGPPHRVKITKPFLMGRYHVTVKQYFDFLHASSYQPFFKRKQVDRIPYKQTPNFPVIYVTWEDAVAFCDWLSKKERRKYRLPTDAEWEYACRAGSQTAFSFGDDPGSLGKHGWFKDNSENQAHPVGTRAPNRWGLYDMHGNAFQWTADWYAPDYYKNSPLEDPPGPGPTLLPGQTKPFKVMRGGEYSYDAAACRSAARKGRPADYATPRTGFRVVLDLDQPIGSDQR